MLSVGIWAQALEKAPKPESHTLLSAFFSPALLAPRKEVGGEMASTPMLETAWECYRLIPIDNRTHSTEKNNSNTVT